MLDASMARRGSTRLFLLLAAVLLFVVFPSTVNFLLEWLWFGAIGYRSVFLTGLRAQASLGAFVLGAAFVMLFGNLWIAISSIASPYIVLASRSGPGMVEPAMIRREHLFRITGIACVVVAALMGLVAGGEWLPWLQFWHGVPFGI